MRRFGRFFGFYAYLYLDISLHIYAFSNPLLTVILQKSLIGIPTRNATFAPPKFNATLDIDMSFNFYCRFYFNC